ncbi:SAF domain-containing protein [Rhodococcus sp. NPDC058505]|uniref:SAF domain-containing protein n=1 Tax=unclassified Rhodococcus (in: high G+C Gram-positive bacteria) TaxID=192944 RepID=UPI0036460AD9
MVRDARRRPGALSPTPVDRLLRLTRPDWTRTALPRRIAAGILAALALVLAIRGEQTDRVSIVATARDLGPGTVLTAADLRLLDVPDPVPDGSLRSLDAAVGHTLAGPARAGEPLTDVRILGSRLAEAAAGPDARIVPVRIEDAEVAGLVRVGDRVDILAVDAEGAAAPRVLASAATVVLVGEKDDGRAARAPVVLAALPEATATTVAAASLTGALTVTFH